MITKFYEIGCDNCGCAEHFPGCSKKEAERQFLTSDDGGAKIIKGKHYCCEKCRPK